MRYIELQKDRSARKRSIPEHEDHCIARAAVWYSKLARKPTTAPIELKLDTVVVKYLEKRLAQFGADQSTTSKVLPFEKRQEESTIVEICDEIDRWFALSEENRKQGKAD